MLIQAPHLTDIQVLELAYATTCQKLDAAKSTIEVLETNNAKLEAEISALKEKLRLAQSKEFGKSSEQSSPPDESNFGKKTTVSGYTRKAKNAPRGKTTDLSHLPHFQIHHDLPEGKKFCVCCQAPLALIGKDITKKLEVLPQKLYVAEHLCYKYTCRTCETITEVKKEKSAIPKGLGGDSLIAEILENKYQHHLPLYRQSLMLANLNAPIADNTLSNWVMQVGEGLLPLYAALWKAILGSRYLQVDETPVKILKPDKQGYLWTYFAPLVGQGLVVFEASLTRSGEVAKKRLKPFDGLLQTDAYNGYQSLRSRKGIIPCGCLSHARRKFKEVITVSGDGEGVAHEMVERLKPLYQLEERMRKAHYPMRARKKLRQKVAKPLLKAIHSWLNQLMPHIPTKSKLGQAIAYTLRQWSYLTQYLRHGWAQIDTNWVENQIRPIAVGKKNFLFMGHEKSASIHALFYSLVLSAILNKINPRLYLNYLLTQLHLLRQKKIDPYLLLPHIIDKAALQVFAHNQLKLAKSVLNDIA
jgi:transposase